MKNSQLLFCVIIIGANVSIFNLRRILRGNGKIFKWEDAQRQLGGYSEASGGILGGKWEDFEVGGYSDATGRLLRGNWEDTGRQMGGF